VDGRDEQVENKYIANSVMGILLQAQYHAKKTHLQSTYDRVWEGGGPFYMAAAVSITWQQLQYELKVLRECIEADLEKRLFVFVEPKNVDLFTAIDDTWKQVLEVIPDAKTDIEDAHIARMVELHTATIFHLMRVAEHGLRILAKKMRVSLDLKDKKGIVPVEYADWQKVITALKNKLTKIAVLKTGPKRQAQLEKYSDAADHCVFMKDIWRNTVSHARKPYKAADALGALERVRDFMRLVAREFA